MDKNIQRVITTFLKRNPQWVIVFTLLAIIFPWINQWIAPILNTGTQNCTVIRIHDGDTMRLNCAGESISVRMICIDAPETAQKPWGMQSRDYLRSQTDTEVELIAHEKDRYGRTVGEVISKGKNLNLAQVQAGQAAVYRQYCKDPRFISAETQAKNKQLGIWSSPGSQQTPWEWRKNTRADN